MRAIFDGSRYRSKSDIIRKALEKEKKIDENTEK